MVEQIEILNLIKFLSSLTLKIFSKDLKRNFRRIERDKKFIALLDNEKIEKILNIADDEILEEHEELEKGKPISRITYLAWKSHMLNKFEKKVSIKEFLKSFQQKTESGRNYFQRIRKIGDEIVDNKELILEVGYRGLRYYKEEIETFTIRFKEISEDFLDTVEKLEEIKKEAFFRKSNKYKCKGKNYKSNVKQVNDIEPPYELFSNNSIYLEGHLFRCVFDTGSEFNFISKKVVALFSTKIKKLKKPMKLYTCLLDEFLIDSYAKLNFKVKVNHFSDIFYIIPKRNDKMVIVGKNWMLKKNVENNTVVNKTLDQIISDICEDKKEGFKGFECEINTEIGKKIVDFSYKLPQSYEEAVQKEISRLLKKNYIQESKSTWLNNVRPVIKKDNSVRLTTNLIKLNKIVEQDSYTIPKMEELIYRLGKAKVFSKIDLKEGFFQVLLKKEDRMKTAFRIKNKTYEWTRMPMGFKNAPAIFQRIMDKILYKEIVKCCFVYIDDILVFSESIERHDLKRVCMLLNEAGLTKIKWRLEKNLLNSWDI